MAAKTKKLKITQVRSTVGCKHDQVGTIRALGLKRINHSVEQDDTPVIRGMVFKVKHLIEVEEL
ncbi:MAG: 50S ribosomal protein L30 [Actinomycetes bacterium]|jgi:large subunit ribosomal protein L30|nr:50S ribosomal protein L30 [Actinomycetes bacterium]